MLVTAVYGGNLTAASVLLEHGANLDRADGGFGYTPLHRVCQRENPDVGWINLLLQHGADVNRADGEYGYTALHWVCQRENPDVGWINLLLQHGADVNIADGRYGYTALHLVCGRENPDVGWINLLLQHGADVNIADGVYGYTALHWVCQRENPDVGCINLLLQHGADVNLVDRWDQSTPLDVYHHYHHHYHRTADPDIVRLLKYKNEEAFGTPNTMALLLSGWNRRPEVRKVYKQSQEQIKQLLVDHFNIISGNIVTVTCEDKETAPRTTLLSQISEVKERLKTKTGNFLFYYVGDNDRGKKQFPVRQDDDSDNPDNYITHEELKERLGEIQALYKLFIINTDYSGGVDLFPVSVDEENYSSVLQWSSMEEDQSTSGDKRKLLYFTKTLQDVLSHHECDHRSCRELPQHALVYIKDLYHCVCQHVQGHYGYGYGYDYDSDSDSDYDYDQPTMLKYNRARKSFYTFPLIAKRN